MSTEQTANTPIKRRQAPPPTGSTIDDRFVRRAHEFGWGMHYLLHGEEQMRAWRDQILVSPGKFVIEHLGNPLRRARHR
jgi:hypothetical protein